MSQEETASSSDTLPAPCPSFNPCDGLVSVAVRIGDIDRQLSLLNTNLIILIAQVKTIGLALGIKFASEAMDPIDGTAE